MAGRPGASDAVIVEKWPRLYVSDIKLDEASLLRGRVNLTFTLDGVSLPTEVRLTFTHAHFGGSRCWFLCPRCSRRVGVLFVVERVTAVDVFACRVCMSARYLSEMRKGRSERMVCMRMVERYIAKGNGTRLRFGGCVLPDAD